ncbi:TonB-dependent receptor [Flavobacterium sp. DG1-102-2]|uniref:TonB-dependent receptor n=1 Tax=Flavobacterium sp. DG1-102-2 TaxID=3081663 RepID=UPI002949873D|nr:TonB-dependent receptor [Flavobacterium sp. DG1-102-2]MDV6167521.1 TonB-dependent receptor [Flavobacterium sp. DG1-102-2]
MLKIIFPFLFFLLAIPALAQTQLTGKITALSGETLPGASVVIKNNEGKFVAYGISQENGSYTLTVKKGGDYTLEVNFLGFQKITQKITLTDGKNLTQNFTLKESEEQLKELVIEAEQPVRLHGDTLVYDAKALSTGHEVVVEDLLKNIPGVTVQKDGKIFYGETEVEKVMVDGDDLFNRGYSLLTKNMPSKPLDKVEVLQNYSNNKLLKGIEDSKGVALNLTIDEKYKNLWFGDASLGYGNDERYNVGGNLMNFSKLYKNFLTVNLNNAGYDRVGDINGMIYNSNDMESTGGAGNATSIMSGSLGGPRLDESRFRFNNAEMATLSTVIPLSQKVKLTLKGFLGFDELRGWNNSYSVVDIPGTFFENTQSNSAKNKLKKGYVSAYFNYDISKTKMLQWSSSLNKGTTDYRNDLVFNGAATREDLDTRNTYFDQKLTYTQKWNERNVVLLKARFMTDKLPQQYGMNDYLLGDLFQYDNITDTGNSIRSKKQYAGLQADFKLKQKNNDLIEFTVGYDDNRDDLSTRFSLFTDTGAIQPDGFQSHSKYNVGDLYANSGYKWELGKLSIGANASIHQLFNRFEGTEGSTKKQNPFFVNPVVNASFRFNPQNILSANYSYRVSNSSLLQVNDAYVLTSSRSFSKGLGYFNQLESSSAGISYATKHYLNRYSFNWGLNYSKQNDAIRSRTQLDQNSSLSEAFVMKGGDRFAANFNSHIVVKKLKGSVQAGVTASKSVYYNIVNESGLRKINSYMQNYTLGWRSDFKAAFDFNIGTAWDYSQTKTEMTFKNSTKVSFLDLMYKSGKNFNMKLTTEHYNFGGLDRFNDYFFSDFESSYSFKDQKYIITLNARNLFNTDTFTTYSISDTGYSTYSYRLLPRYVMLSLKFRF